jgi:hypothetical protein
VNGSEAKRGPAGPLETERGRRGLSRDDVARLTRIPVRYVQALEQGDHDVLPPGPFLTAYRRQYLEFLGLDEQDLMQTERAPAPEIPLGRLVLGGFLITVGVVVALRLGAYAMTWMESRPEAATAAPAPAVGAQTVAVRAIDRTKLTVTVDEGAPEQIVLAPGETREVKGTGRVVVDAPDLTRVVLTYNGEKVEPLGNLSHRRRLVFLSGD